MKEDYFYEAICALKEYKDLEFKLNKTEYALSQAKETLERIVKTCKKEENWNILGLSEITLKIIERSINEIHFERVA